MKLFECRINHVLIGQRIHRYRIKFIRLIILAGNGTEQNPDKFDLLNKPHISPEAGKRDIDVAVNEHEADSALFGKADCLLHLRARFNTDI